MDPVIKKLRELGTEENRENYLQLAYFGNVPEHLSAEEEANLPEQFQFKGDK